MLLKNLYTIISAGLAKQNKTKAKLSLAFLLFIFFSFSFSFIFLNSCGSVDVTTKLKLEQSLDETNKNLHSSVNSWSFSGTQYSYYDDQIKYTPTNEPSNLLSCLSATQNTNNGFITYELNNDFTFRLNDIEQSNTSNIVWIDEGSNKFEWCLKEDKTDKSTTLSKLVFSDISTKQSGSNVIINILKPLIDNIDINIEIEDIDDIDDDDITKTTNDENVTFSFITSLSTIKIKISLNDESKTVSSPFFDINILEKQNIGNLKTGQTTSYQDGDDGYYQKGLTRAFSRDDDKKIVTDTTTGLMWQDDSDVSDDDKKTSWSDAISYCEDLSLGEYSDWSLPTRAELLTIVDRSKYDPSINDVFLYTASGGYWSSTSGASGTSNAWGVSFWNGAAYSNDKSTSYFVRCVRGGQ